MSEEEQNLAIANDKLDTTLARAKQLTHREDADRALEIIGTTMPASAPAIEEDPQVRISRARNDLAEKLDELRRREAKARATVAPLKHLANPWVQLGIAFAAGLVLGAWGEDRD
ncbi:MAG TPA: hypothetical protein VGC41_11555 [Kofleriaceae bacterium]